MRERKVSELPIVTLNYTNLKKKQNIYGSFVALGGDVIFISFSRLIKSCVNYNTH